MVYSSKDTSGLQEILHQTNSTNLANSKAPPGQR